MKILEVILLAIAGAFLVIGAHQLFVGGFVNAYPFFMTMIGCFMGYGYLKIKNNEAEQLKINENPAPLHKKKTKK